jgi:hypothetical protein
MNLVERTFKEYLEVFHSTLSETANEYFPPDSSHKLLHLSFLPAQIIGYVSTQFGVGFEYVSAKETSVKIVIGGARVENIFLRLPKSYPNREAMIDIQGVDVLMSGFTMKVETRLPFQLTKQPSNVFIKEVCFEINSRKRIVNYGELYSNRDVENWSREKAITRAKNEVLSGLIELNRSRAKGISIDEYTSVHKEKTILLLGDYDETGLQRLQLIGNALEKLGYEPLLIKDVPDHPHQDLSQKVISAGAVARFIVVDDSSKSGHLMEIPICKQNNWVTILLRAESSEGTLMTAGASAFSKVILEKTYSLTSLEKDILEATLWAEETIKNLEKRFSEIYPLRKTDQK